MEAESQRPNERESAISALNAAIEDLNLAEKISSIPPAKAVFGSVIVLLTLIRDFMANKPDRVKLGLLCADICRELDRGTSGKRPGELNQTVYGAINRLTLTAANIERKLAKWGKRNVVSRWFHAKKDKKTVAAWRVDLEEILRVFNSELARSADAPVPAVRRDVASNSGVQNDVSNTAVVVSDGYRNTLKSPDNTRGKNRMPYASAPEDSPPPLPGSTHGTVSDIRNDVMKSRAILSDIHRAVVQNQEESGSKHSSTQASVSGESPPLPPRTFFGRDELIERVVDLAEKFIPIALIGAGGIGKTSVALAVLHHDRIKQQFGHHRRFIRCDQFPASRTHLLQRLSNVIGAGVENPEDLTPLRTFLSSRVMLIVLDNAESILDPQGTDAQKIYTVVEELSRFDNICICITSRISTTPPGCKHLDVPTLSMDAACDTFYRIYDSDDRSDLIDISSILEQLDFHPLSITLLATVAHQNKWGMVRLAQEWERRRTNVLQTQHKESLAAAIELSLASPMFQELGPDARELLGVVAFFPQGVDENNLNWLFSTVPNRADIFDRFSILSLTYRSNGFIMMLAPLRDYLSSKDPKASPLLCATKEHYFTRMSVETNPDSPNYGETQWITSEDVNVEHLLDVFTTIDVNSDGVWNACTNFMVYLTQHKRRPTVLGPKIEGLPDDHRSKPRCLFALSLLTSFLGNPVEQKRLLVRASMLWRESGNENFVVVGLMMLSNANRELGLYEEGMEQVKEASEIYERLGDTAGQAQCLINIALSLLENKQPDAAEEAALRAIDLSEKSGQFLVCESHQILGMVYKSTGKIEKAIHHFEVALGIATSPYSHDFLFTAHLSLAEIFRNQDRLDDAQAHIELAKPHVVNSPYNLGGLMEEQAVIWYKRHRLEEARSEALRAADVFDKLGAAKDLERCREFIRGIEKELNSSVSSGRSGLNVNSQGTE